MIKLVACPKGYTLDQDKAMPPARTIQRVRERLSDSGTRILAATRRIDTGRLGIPVFLSECGPDARAVMPTRKQMGKGASPEQAEASALMELVERFSFFTRWNSPAAFQVWNYSEAEACSPLPVMPLKRILQSVQEELPEEQARRIMDLWFWQFHPATDLCAGKEEMIPLEWFKILNEFNGSSAGNTHEESILQGACELVERHVCALTDRERRPLPTIDPTSLRDPVLLDLMARFTRNGVQVLLKDMTLGQPVPTVGAICHDPATLAKGHSEIVYTAGTASSPAKAAIRALTEVAQLAGDFETASVYEASGLPKYASLEEARWLQDGPVVALDSLPDVETDDFRDELLALCKGLQDKDLALYSVDMTHPGLGIPAHYNLVPGFQFRERDRHASLGLFVGRKLAEQAPLDDALTGLEILADVYPKGHFLPFFQGLLQLRLEEYDVARQAFCQAEPLQPDADNQALAAFYTAYSHTLQGQWQEALPPLDRAIACCNEHKEFYNLRGVAQFKLGIYEKAALDFTQALQLDRGSAMDLANLGLCYKFMGESDKARQALQTALELEPGLDFARTHLEELGA